jgi:nitrite reductase/ring-hydroxylating ferredoxin subunit
VFVPPGSGAVVRRGLRKIAVYCDAAGQLHEWSAGCPHLGGIVAWNHSERTWDCPCHGSRFDKLGKVLNGPAITNLPPAEEPSALGSGPQMPAHLPFHRKRCWLFGEYHTVPSLRLAVAHLNNLP